MHDDAAETTGRRLVKNRFVKLSNKPGADYRRSAPGFVLDCGSHRTFQQLPVIALNVIGIVFGTTDYLQMFFCLSLFPLLSQTWLFSMCFPLK